MGSESGAEFLKCVEHHLTEKGQQQKPHIEQEKKIENKYIFKNSESVKIICFFFTFFQCYKFTKLMQDVTLG